jgi:hypothetical protein
MLKTTVTASIASRSKPSAPPPPLEFPAELLPLVPELPPVVGVPLPGVEPPLSLLGGGGPVLVGPEPALLAAWTVTCVEALKDW